MGRAQRLGPIAPERAFTSKWTTPAKRVLRVMKANDGRVGEEIALRWNDGAFVLDQGAMVPP